MWLRFVFVGLLICLHFEVSLAQYPRPSTSDKNAAVVTHIGNRQKRQVMANDSQTWDLKIIINPTKDSNHRPRSSLPTKPTRKPTALSTTTNSKTSTILDTSTKLSSTTTTLATTTKLDTTTKLNTTVTLATTTRLGPTTLNTIITLDTTSKLVTNEMLDGTGSGTGPTISMSTPVSRCCPAAFVRGVFWKEHCAGNPANNSCPSGAEGAATWRCSLESGKWMTDTPDLSNCTSETLRHHFKKINITNVPKALTLIQNSPRKAFGGDIILTGEYMKKVMSHFKLFISSEEDSISRKETAASLTEQVADITDDLIGSSSAWNDLIQDKRVSVASFLLEEQQKAAFEFAYALNESTVVPVSRNHLYMEVMKESKGSFDEKDLHLPRNPTDQDKDSYFSLPAGFERKMQSNREDLFTYVVYLKYHDMSRILKIRNNDIAVNSPEKTIVNSPIISVSLDRYEEKVSFTDKKVLFLLPHLQGNADRSACAFWNTRSLNWDTEGCETVDHNSSFTQCACDHLTNFAVLMDVHGGQKTLSDADLKALKIITQIGCIFSIVFLTAAIVVTTVYRALWGMRNSVHRNVDICFLIADIIFVIGIDRTEIEVLCSVIAGFLHYFFLAAFCWMFLEAVVIYFLLYKVFSPKKSYTRRFYAIGYGVPMLIVAISSSLRPSGYGAEKSCWLSTSHGFIFSFVGPVALILLVNFVALVYALYIAVRANKKKNPKAGPNVTKTWIIGALTLVPLLGVTWAFGLLLLSDEPVMVYIFTVLNSLQGVAIFVVQCLLNQSSRKCLMETFGKYTQRILFGSSLSTGQTNTQTTQSSTA